MDSQCVPEAASFPGRGARSTGSSASASGSARPKAQSFSFDDANNELHQMSSTVSDGSWEANAATCSICDCKLGKRYMTPRHHCRVCGRCVCSKCSPNSIQLDGTSTLVRVCSACTAATEKLPRLTTRLVVLGERLGGLCGAGGVAPPRPKDIEDAVAYCERMMAPLEERHDRFSAAEEQKNKLETEAQTARAACTRLRQQLHALIHSRPHVLEHCGSVEEALALTEAALVPLEGSPYFQGFTVHEVTPSMSAQDSVSGVDVESQAGESSRQGACAYVSRRLLKIFWLASFFISMVLLPAFAFCEWVGPVIMRHSLHSTSVTVVDAKVSDATNSSVQLELNISLGTCSFANMHIQGFNATLRAPGAGGGALGWFYFPGASVVTHDAARVPVSARFHVIDRAAVSASLAGSLQGRSELMEITGSADVTMLGLTIRRKVSKLLELPPMRVEQLESQNVDIVSGDEASLNASVDVSFVSLAALEIGDLGEVDFTLHPVSEDRTIDYNVRIGRLVIPSARLLRGHNILKSLIVFEKSPASESHLSKFLADWASGIRQTVLIHGPIGSGLPVQASLITQAIQVMGVPQALASAAFISKADTFLGHDRATGNTCTSLNFAECLRGAVFIAGNMFHSDVRLTNMSFDLNLNNDLSYDTTLHMLGSMPKRVSCRKGARVARAFSTPGMWTYMDPERAQDASVTLPRAPPGGKRSTTSFFLPGKPQPGQSDDSPCYGTVVDPLDCCFTTLLPVAACYYKRQDLNYIPVTMTGNLTLTVGSFQIDSAISRVPIDLVVAGDVPNFSIGPFWMSCKDVAFHEDVSYF